MSPSERITLEKLQGGQAARVQSARALEPEPSFSSVKVDDIIYSDRTYAGPDRSGNILFTRMDWNAAHDSGISALKAAAQYPSDDDLKKYLAQYPSKREPANGDHAHDLYYEARERATARLLFALNTLGRQSLLINAKNYAAQKPLGLTPASTSNTSSPAK